MVTPFLNVVVCVCFIIFCTLSSSVNVWTQALLETRNLGSSNDINLILLQRHLG